MSIPDQREAYQSLIKLFDQIEECRRLFERAGLPIPEQVKLFTVNSNGSGKPNVPRARIEPIHRNSRPLEADDEWISIDISEANATSLVLAVLRAAGQPIKAGDVIEQVMKLNAKVPRGSVHNIGTRLDGREIRRAEEGWSLIHPEKAPIAHDGYIWGPKESFEKQELAAHRREAILHILRCFPSGMQIVQIVDQLRGCYWMKAPATKDLLKADMDLLEGHGKVRRISNSRKWEVAP
jgi:hypothetical protein